jgi:hypothetical protein
LVVALCQSSIFYSLQFVPNAVPSVVGRYIRADDIGVYTVPTETFSSNNTGNGSDAEHIMENKVVGGEIKAIAWDPTAHRFAVSFTGNTTTGQASDPTLIALYTTRSFPTLDFTPR